MARQLVGHILRHLHSKALSGFWVCSSKRKPKVPPASNHWTIDLDLTQGSQYHCFAGRWAFLRAALARSKMQQNLRTSRGACRQAIKDRKQEANLAGTWFGGAAPKQLRTALASSEDPDLDSGLLVGPSFGAGAVSPSESWSDCS